MKLSDGGIRRALFNGITIEPFPNDRQIQPCSVDLRLSSSWCWPRENNGNDHKLLKDSIYLPSGAFVLGCTLEKVTLGRGYMGQVHGKSSWARRGLVVEAAGLVDPGFSGALTLEIFNMSKHPIPLLAGQAICQITFERLEEEAERPYGDPALGSHYQFQTGATPAGEDPTCR